MSISQLKRKKDIDNSHVFQQKENEQEIHPVEMHSTEKTQFCTCFNSLFKTEFKDFSFSLKGPLIDTTPVFMGIGQTDR